MNKMKEGTEEEVKNEKKKIIFLKNVCAMHIQGFTSAYEY